MKSKKYIFPDKLTLDNLTEVIDNFPTKNKRGFTRSETHALLDKYNIDVKVFGKEMGTNTAMVIDGETVSYASDIELTIRCILRGRNKNAFEFD